MSAKTLKLQTVQLTKKIKVKLNRKDVKVPKIIKNKKIKVVQNCYFIKLSQLNFVNVGFNLLLSFKGS